MGKEKNKFDFDSGSIFVYMFKKAKVLLIVSVAAFIVSAIVSFLITPKFKSTAIVFPASPASVSKSVMNTQYVSSRASDLLNFGQEEECDQLLQVFNSLEIKDWMNQKYNLMKHYEIDSTKNIHAKSDFYNDFDDHFNFRRSEYLSIVIEVYDKDPVLAANMANDVVAFVDTLFTKMQKSRSQKAFSLIEKEYLKLDSLIESKQSKITELSKLGIYKHNDQAKTLDKAYYKALEEGKNQLANDIKKQIDLVRKHGVEFTNLQYELNYLHATFSSMFYKYTEARSELEQNLPNKFIVQSAQVSDKKASPKRMIIVLTSTLAAFFLAFILLVFIDSLKKHF